MQPTVDAYLGDPPAHLVRFCPKHRDMDPRPFYDAERKAYVVLRVISPGEQEA